MKKMLLLLCVLAAFSSLLISQTYVAPGEGTLYQAIESAVDGEVLQLVPGGLYTEATNDKFGTIQNKSITIEAESEDGEKPILQLLTTATDDDNVVFFSLGEQGSLTLKGLECDGSLNDAVNATYLATFYMGEFPAEIHVKKIAIENCYIHNLTSHVISAGNPDMKYNVNVDSTTIDNSIIKTTGTIVYYKYCAANYVSATNSTFDTINSYGFRICGSVESGISAPGPTVVVDHTTWYNIGTEDQREILLAEKEPAFFQNPWTVANSIFVKQIKGTTDKVFINIKDTVGDSLATIASICFWDIVKIGFRGHTVTDTIRIDPGFADPENGDFTLPWKSPLLTFGTDGGPIGDPRWAGNAVALEPESGIAPTTFSLNQNYPNPFNPSTNIAFSLEKSGMTTLSVYDLLGNEVAVLLNKNLNAGVYRLDFNAAQLSSGIYFYRLTSSGKTLTKKMMFIE